MEFVQEEVVGGRPEERNDLTEEILTHFENSSISNTKIIDDLISKVRNQLLELLESFLIRNPTGNNNKASTSQGARCCKVNITRIKSKCS